jgi:serine/threonine-protein kinase
MQRRTVLDSGFYCGVTLFLAAQTLRNFLLDTEAASDSRAFSLVISLAAVSVALSGWIIRFSESGISAAGPFGHGLPAAAAWTAWHLAVLTLIGVRAAGAFEANVTGTGDIVVHSYFWIIGAAVMLVLTIVHFVRPPRMRAAAAPPPPPMTRPVRGEARVAAPVIDRAPATETEVDVATIGKYEIRGLLGRGAMGTVYDAFDPVIQRRVALKMIHRPGAADQAVDAEAAEISARFRREAQAAGRLHHPNIVEIFDYGETAETAYIVMEYVDGTTLAALLDARRPTLAETLRLMHQLLAGLHYSHERGVVHRDIKPANIMIARDGTLKITDFGIARVDSSELTQTGRMLGTAAYMSPEQFMGEAVDARGDIYSAAILLFRMLTGERPFEGAIGTIMEKVLNAPPPIPSERAAGVSREFDAVVRRAMARKPADRFASAAAFSAALRDAAAAPHAEATMVMSAANFSG